MKPSRIHSRKPQRLSAFDYATDGAYFVTVCTAGRVNFFGEIREGKMMPNICGQIIQQQWQWLSLRYPFITLDEFSIMPNHFHGILFINRIAVMQDDDGSVGNGRDHSLPCPKIKSLSELVGAFKTTSSKRIHRETSWIDFAWQKSFYDRIIRDESELNRIRDYIFQNPQSWGRDPDNLACDRS